MKKLILLIAFFALPATGYAQDAFYLGGVLGLAQPDGDGVSNNLDYELTFGGRAGVLFNDHIRAGVYFSRYSDSTGAGLAKIETTVTPLLAEFGYNFEEADENGLYLAGLLGLTTTKVDALISSENSDTTLGAVAGYHFMVAPNFSLGPEFFFANVMADNSYTMMGFFMNITGWF